MMRYAFFPEQAVISLLALTTDGSATEIAMVCRGGVVGLPIVLPVPTAPYQAVVQLAGDAHRVRADLLRAEFGREPSVQQGVLDSLHRQLAEITQSNVCN